MRFVHWYTFTKTVRLISLKENNFRSKTAEQQWGGESPNGATEFKWEFENTFFLSKLQYRSEKG